MSFKQMSFHRASVSENDLSAGALSNPWWGLCFPWHRIHIISTTLSPPSSLEQRFSSLVTAFLSVFHKLNILLVPETPTTSVHCRLPPSIHASLSFFLLCFYPQEKPIFFKYRLFSLLFVLPLWLSSSLFCCPVGLWKCFFFSFFFFLFINYVKPSTLPMSGSQLAFWSSKLSFQTDRQTDEGQTNRFSIMHA